MRECPIEVGASSDARKFLDDVVALQEGGFVKPLLSVLFFASWAMERLRQRDRRLWKELHRDLSSVTSFTMKEAASDLRPVAASHMFSSTSDDQNGSESEMEASAKRLGPVSEHDTHSDGQPSSTSAEPQLPKATCEQRRYEEDEELEEEEEEEEEHNSEESSVGTFVVNAGLPKTSVTEAMLSNLKKAAKLRKEARLKRSNRINDPSRLLQRESVALFLHFACILLVHMGFGDLCFGEKPEELSSRFFVVESAFDALGILLKDISTQGTFRASSSLKQWLKLSFARLQRRSAMMRGQRNWDGGGTSLTFESCLYFEGTVFDVGRSGTPSSSVELVLKELFLNITGQGRNVRGRHFLLRCLHEFSTWLRPNSYEDIDANAWRHLLHSYISLLSLKVARVISFCLSYTTGVLVVGCDFQHKWMERTAVQLAGANAFKRFVTALSRQMNALQNESPSSVMRPFVRVQAHKFCASVLRSLACLLSDIIIHETYYCTEVHTGQAEGRKQDALLLSAPFGDNSSFPAHYLLTCFWTGFAFLLDPDMWQAACDVLTVFHRYGCAQFLGTISRPPLPLLYPLGINVTPDCEAVQLVLLRQGKEDVVSRKKRVNPTSAAQEEHDVEHTVDVVLNYLNEYAGEKEEPAVLLAFTELLLLCDWVSLDYETHAPRFTAFARRGMRSLDFQGQLPHKLSAQREMGPAPSSVYRPFTRYVCYFAESWKRGLLLLPPGCERTAEGLSSRMMFMLGDFFHTALKIFDVPSVELLLHRVIGGSCWKQESVELASSLSKSRHTDLCSLHSCADSYRKSQELNAVHVTSFQRQFEALVVAPFTFLFQSPETPLPLWSKILALVAALLRYHEQNHGFVTDQLLKFLPDIERGLGVGTASSAFTDGTPLYDRLVVLVLADEVSSKVKRLRMAAWTKTPSTSPFDSGSAVSLLASLLDNQAFVATLMDKLTTDPFSAYSATNTGTSTQTELVTGLSKPSASGRTDEWELKPSQTAPRKSRAELQPDDEKGQQPPVAPRKISVLPDEEEASSLLMQSTQRCTTVSSSHRFGSYVYETLPGASNAVQLTGQLPLEYYCLTAKEAPSAPDLIVTGRNSKAEEALPLAQGALPERFFLPPGHTTVFASTATEASAASLTTSTGKKLLNSDDDSSFCST
ncbi:uncharacterized protein Tco025E_03511 [Trypanosoma conorhini]|uniref:Uncharacterized protein n=1 Tax=Trypanosoma conorhini TaxID=83891 RepID=A0A422PTY1_9TRYP|nr:uncharacterized protein Tco025E_03511 [Trypanosoma conorhini]RNF21170.1 hypothetical protein Tco025E_03511 [Trypanosoma conorhini]